MSTTSIIPMPNGNLHERVAVLEVRTDANEGAISEFRSLLMKTLIAAIGALAGAVATLVLMLLKK